MRTLTRLFVVLVLLFLGDVVRAGPLGAVVQTWRYDGKSQPPSVIVRVLNTSGKDITAFNLSVTERYADGTIYTSERTEEFLPLVVGSARAFAPGTSHDVVFPVQKEPVDVALALDVVLYLDATAESTNNRAFNEMVAFRKGTTVAMQQAEEVLKTSASKEVAAKELKRLADVAKTRSPRTELTLRRIADEVGSTSDLLAYVQSHHTKTVLYGQHSEFKVQP